MDKANLFFELQLEDVRHQAILDKDNVSNWIIAALANDVESAEITLRIVNEEEGLGLNETYRGKDYATNILTFDYSHSPTIIADLIICAPVVEREAQEQNKTIEAHYAHLVVHGVLHAQGWKHDDEAEAQKMEALETQILMDLGFASPYESE